MVDSGNEDLKWLGLIARFARWLLQNARPQYHYALMVLHYAAWFIAASLAVDVVLRMAGWRYPLDVEWVGVLTGSLALGGLVAGHVRMRSAIPERLQSCLIPAVFGGSAGVVIGVVFDLTWHSPRLQTTLTMFGAGAALFMLLTWLIRLDARKRHDAWPHARFRARGGVSAARASR